MAKGIQRDWKEAPKAEQDIEAPSAEQICKFMKHVCKFMKHVCKFMKHALKVLLNDKVDRIPEMYVCRRWRCDLVPARWLPARVRYGEVDEEKERLIGRVFYLVESIVDAIRNDKASLSSFVDHMENWDSEIHLKSLGQSSRERKDENMEDFFGVTQPDSVEIFPPTGIRNKGCGTSKRLVGVREKAVNDAKTMKRRCKNCKKLAKHDSRNCPERGLKD